MIGGRRRLAVLRGESFKTLCKQRFQRFFYLRHRCVGLATSNVPSAHPLQISKGGRAAQTPLGPRWRFQQIKVVTHQPNDAGRDHALEQLSANLSMVRRVHRFTYVVEQGCCP